MFPPRELNTVESLHPAKFANDSVYNRMPCFGKVRLEHPYYEENYTMTDHQSKPEYKQSIENHKLNYRACIPFYILLDNDLSKKELALYGIIEQMESINDYVFYNNRTLAQMLGVSHESNSVTAMRRKLESKGYIKRELKRITIKGKTVERWCWNTIKPGLVAVEEDDEGVVPEPQGGGVVEPQGGGVVEPQPYNNHNLKTKTNKEHLYIPDSDKSGSESSDSQKEKAPSKTDKSRYKSYKQDERFMKFYYAYPRKADPRDAYKAFLQIVGDDDNLLNEVLKDIEERKKEHSAWLDGYVKYPAVYLRKGEFEGEVINIDKETKEREIAKQEKQAQKVKEREEMQERLSKQRQKEEAQKYQRQREESEAYRNITKEVEKRKSIKERLGWK